LSKEDASVRHLPWLHFTLEAVVHAATASLQFWGKRPAGVHSVVLVFKVFLDLFGDSEFGLVTEVCHSFGLSGLLFGFEEIVLHMGFKSLHEIGTVNLSVLVNCTK